MSAVGRRIYMIRHGKADHRSSGEAATSRGLVADPPLDETGKEQAQALTRRLLKMPAPGAIYCSTLTRAKQTIAPYVDATGSSVTYDEDLAEWFGGAWEFKEFEELLIEHPEIPQRVLLQDPLFFLAPGSESYAAFVERIVRVIEDALSKHPEGDLWMVCHGGVINAYLGWVLRLADQEMFFLPPNTSINTIKVAGDTRALWFLADDTHWTEPRLFDDPEARPGTDPPMLRAPQVETKEP
jgi:2,3-bisphosphoglycerate-dependent phosphoglycerate mutase